MLTKLSKLLVIAAVAMLTACATMAEKNAAPVRTATVIDSQHSIRKVFTPSVGGAAAGAAAGGLLGNQIGKGNGRKLATALGAVAGGVAGGAAAGTESTVPISLIIARDDATGELFRLTLDGTWNNGMKLRYSKDGDKIVVR